MSDWVAAFSTAIQLTLLGGIPAAITGAWLSRRTRVRATRWSANWSPIFLGGFIFQLSNIFLAPLMFVAFVSYVGDVRLAFNSPEGIGFSAVLMLIVGCSAAALRPWLNLRAAVRDDALTIN